LNACGPAIPYGCWLPRAATSDGTCSPDCLDTHGRAILLRAPTWPAFVVTPPRNGGTTLTLQVRILRPPKDVMAILVRLVKNPYLDIYEKMPKYELTSRKYVFEASIA
jgi:hypothetical protein